jgi:hypothetical protein
VGLDLKKDVPHAGFHIRDVVASMVNTLVRNEDVDIRLTGGDLSDAAFEIPPSGVDRLVVVCPKDREGAMTHWGAWHFLIARVVYVCFTAGVPYIRSLVWLVSPGGILLVLIPII